MIPSQDVHKFYMLHSVEHDDAHNFMSIFYFALVIIVGRLLF